VGAVLLPGAAVLVGGALLISLLFPVRSGPLPTGVPDGGSAFSCCPGAVLLVLGVSGPRAVYRRRGAGSVLSLPGGCAAARLSPRFRCFWCARRALLLGVRGEPDLLLGLALVLWAGRARLVAFLRSDIPALCSLSALIHVKFG